MIAQLKRTMKRCANGAAAAGLAMLVLGAVARGADAPSAADAAAPKADPAPASGRDRNLFRTLRAMNLSLAKSYESFQAQDYADEERTLPNFDPATFSLSRSSDNDYETTYATQFFLGWSPQANVNLWGGTWTPLLSIEGNLSSKDDSTADAVRLRITGEGVYTTRSQDQVSGLVVNATLKYEADREFDTQKLIGEFEFHPVATGWGIGQRYPKLELVGGKRQNLPPVQLRWEPWLRVDVGKTLDSPTNAAEEEDTVLRLVGVVEGKLFLNGAAEMLGIEEVTLSAGEKFHYLALEDGRQNYNFFSAGVHFQLNRDVSIDITYNIGRDAPTFVKQEVLGVALGIRF